MTSLDNNTIHLGKLAPAGMLLGLIMAAGGIGATIAFGSDESGWNNFWMSYLFAYMVVTGICLGGLFFVMLQHITRAG